MPTPSVGRNIKQFVKMIDTARLNPDESAMIPGRLNKKDAGSWQHEVRQAVFAVQTAFACGLDGKHGGEILRDSYAQDHFVMLRNQRTFGQMLQDTPPARLNIWNAKGHGGGLFNLWYVGLPISMKLLTKLIPGQMRAQGVRNVTYDCVAIYILPKWDLEKQAHTPTLRPRPASPPPFHCPSHLRSPPPPASQAPRHLA